MCCQCYNNFKKSAVKLEKLNGIASTHHEQMENFMAAEVFVKCVKYRKFQSIDYTTDGVDDAAR